MAESLKGSVLLVDDDPAVAKVLGALLVQAGLSVHTAARGDEALALLGRKPIDVVVSDVRMPGMGGLELLAEVQRGWPDVPVILLTAHGTVPLAVEAMKAGAADFALKPFDREEILFSIRKALLRAQQNQEATRPPGKEPGGFVGQSTAMASVQGLLGRAAMGTATVLLRGESGTGKELAAKAVHDASPRRGGPFVKLHCAALPDTLLESELFGYEKGAFTGAATRKPGRVELAHGGTLFLDEIGDITPQVQVKLLRLLQEREFERLGGTQTLKVDVRFVAATHRDLEVLVREGAFREDLFYRLNVVPVWLPPLRARPEDIEPLVRHFLEVHARANGRPPFVLTPEGLAVLRAQPWPGNVRQLQNFIERLVVLSDGPLLSGEEVLRELDRQPGIAPMAAPPPAPSPPPGIPGAAAASFSGGEGRTLESQRKGMERQALVDALQRAGDNRTLAARLLGISRRTLYNKLEEYGLV
ncbi:Response regulator of zinc sigma-54-dependent two-component system [Cystobacter fuscus DSM 2262]|uniref:Response regulator of zinc sigma-54-dependent two-component system n=1 Tax=Cystobacter fuscus (strain ATCC 25194 / DSM 2262 / NBRC 100088 / M29) TaxID=1242864 RepID=S9P037_CYSF2|nr:sigma-54 dependent transcriptional regulator [Cystobacter fuscus]EPX57810.1 Response regulator of zinc sigma-54-dependent two-component system [Cystobacter fuscus DSM 2262]